MGEIADAILNGDMCQSCGVYIEDDEANGFPRDCASCKEPEPSNYTEATGVLIKDKLK